MNNPSFVAQQDFVRPQNTVLPLGLYTTQYAQVP